MKLQTKIPLKPQLPKIDYNSKVLLLGSCFSENIGEKFEFYKFQNVQNPFGVIFNPVSIEKLVVRAITNNLFTENDIFLQNEIWKCFDAHSELSALNRTEILANLNSALQNLREALFSSTHIIITYGTSWVYRNIDTSASLSDQKNQIVANCHKVPQKNFNKELLSIETISESIQNTIYKISKINSKATLVLTVSPVRHIKDGFQENTLSKAHLISAINQYLKIDSQRSSIVNLQSFYFPSFEIMMDELRDYRFYAEDMLHPNKTAIEIIWQHFKEVWIANETENLQNEIETIQNGLKHKPFNPKSAAHNQFQKNLQQKIEKVKLQLPNIAF